MTTQESFKRRVRARMAKTGERYGAARRSMLAGADARAEAQRLPESGSDAAASTPPHPWAANPEVTDAALVLATGRGWDGWCAFIDADPGPAAGHTAIAARLVERHGIDGWWAQTITVGYERIRGLRAPYQMADGTFTAARTRTVPVDPDELRDALRDAHADLFPGLETEMRSRAGAKRIRVAIGPGVAEFTIDPAAGGRARVSIAHAKLPTAEAAEAWRAYWAEWLAALD
jgi:hypothetical protein